MIKRIKNTVPWTYVISDLNGEGIIATFYELIVINKKVINKKRNKLYVKWKGYSDSFNSWIDKKNIV